MERRSVWTVAQIVRLTGRSEQTVTRWIRDKRLVASRPAGGPMGYRVTRADLDRFCRSWLAAPLAELEERAAGQSRDNPRQTP